MNTDSIRYLVLDEYDKILQVRFEDELTRILGHLPNLEKRILTSATAQTSIPGFVQMNEAKTLDYLVEKKHDKLELKVVESNANQNLETLVGLLNHVGNQNGIVFCNFKATIDERSEERRVGKECRSRWWTE